MIVKMLENAQISMGLVSDLIETQYIRCKQIRQKSPHYLKDLTNPLPGFVAEVAAHCQDAMAALEAILEDRRVRRSMADGRGRAKMKREKEAESNEKTRLSDQMGEIGRARG